jgi:hypothetical protein
VLVCPYSEIQSSYSSSFPSLSSSSSHQSQSHDQHGRATAVTMQFPQMSDTGDGMLSPANCCQAQIVIHNCAVNVGDAYILIAEKYGVGIGEYIRRY